MCAERSESPRYACQKRPKMEQGLHCTLTAGHAMCQNAVGLGFRGNSQSEL